MIRNPAAHDRGEKRKLEAVSASSDDSNDTGKSNTSPLKFIIPHISVTLKSIQSVF